jgi:IMP dehydrogenase/GMP reductase
MKSLVEDILASREERAKALGDIRKDVRHIQSDARSMMKDFTEEGEERAQGVKKLGQEVKSFLKSSAETRKADFGVTMKTVHESLVDVRKDSKHARNAGKAIVKDARALIASISEDNKKQAEALHGELKKSDHQRKAEFKSMMGDIGEGLKEIKRDVAKVKNNAQDMVSRYHSSRMISQKHWASLSSVPEKAKK